MNVHGNSLAQPPPPGAVALDWGTGSYESTAEQLQLLPAAHVVVDKASVGLEDRVLDLGCGTGNAALLAAVHSARVTGIDPAARLLDVARARAAREGKEVNFLVGEASAMPLEDSSTDVMVSVFAVIFAPDPHAAAAEIARVLAPGGRIVLSAWVPSGTMFTLNAAAGETVRNALGAPEPERFAWHDPDALTGLFAPHGFAVEVEQHTLAFTAASARDFFEIETTNHPVAVSGLSALARLGQADALRTQLLIILEEGNEHPQQFRITSPYVVATARHDH
jgi:SAM-dependent methyltransferase